MCNQIDEKSPRMFVLKQTLYQKYNARPSLLRCHNFKPRQWRVMDGLEPWKKDVVETDQLEMCPPKMKGMRFRLEVVEEGEKKQENR